MGMDRAWQFRVYPSKAQEKQLINYLNECKNLWNFLLDYTKKYYEKTGKFPTRNQLNSLTKDAKMFSQVSQNVSDRLTKSMKGMSAKKKAGRKAGFPRFKSIERVKSFTYPQFGFKLEEKLVLSGIGNIAIKKHRNILGKIKPLTIKKSPSGKWFAIFTSEVEKANSKKSRKPVVGIDLGIETFAYLSDGTTIGNPRHLKQAESKLGEKRRELSKKKKGSSNRRKAKLRVAVAYEKLANRRRDFLHKVSRHMANTYSLIALENLNVIGMARGFLAKHVLDCSWAEFLNMLRYKAEEAGCEVVLVEPAHTSSMCSNCSLVHKKSLAERWHNCPCGANMHRDLNAAINILNRATSGIGGSQACLRSSLCMQASSMKQEANGLAIGNSQALHNPENSASLLESVVRG